MKAQEFQNILEEALNLYVDENEDSEIQNVQTFDNVGMLTNDKGLVVLLNDGSEFQVTIIRSK